MQVTQFQKIIYDHYKKQGRALSWRKTKDPYKIWISELMLQQTQTERVVPKYKEFLELFPNVALLAKAPTSKVLKAWQGLGYNRRALFAQRAAKMVVDRYASKFPKTVQQLESLPGIGKYTAAAILAFAYNRPIVFIETNIRQVFIHFFFKNKNEIADVDILKLVYKYQDAKNPRHWYYALMDYGAYLKREYGNINTASRHYTKQSKFQGSVRQLRGAIVKLLLVRPYSLTQLIIVLNTDKQKLALIVKTMQQEGLVQMTRGKYCI